MQCFNRVLEGLSGSLDSHALRVDICEDLLRLLKADFIASFIWNDSHQAFEESVFLNMDPANIATYNEHYQFCDPITHKLQQKRKATHVYEVMPQRELEKTEFFNDFLMQDGLHHGVNLYAFDGNLNIGDLRIWRDRQKPDFDPRDFALLEMIKPHFRNALRNARLFADQRGQRDSIMAAWEKAPAPSYLFDENGILLHRNDEADTLETLLPDDLHKNFLQTVHKLQGGDFSETEWGPFCLSVITGETVEGTPYVVVQAKRGETPRLDLQWLMQRRGLSHREGEICLLMAKGLTDAEVGSALGIALSTVRTHIKRLHRRLEVTTRSELLHTLLEGLVDVRF